MKKKMLSVRLYGEPVGILEQTESGKMVFRYDVSANQAISISMPIREQGYDNNHCEAFFGGLLPESDATKKLIGKQYGISYGNSFALLKAIGYDCAGAISFHDISEPVQSQRAYPLQGTVISDKQLYEHIKALPRKPLFLGIDGLRLSLAGVQDKAAVCIIDGDIALPTLGCPTTHILKPASIHFDDIAENEYLCMRIAADIGLPIPTVEIKQVKDKKYLLVERYDRLVREKFVERIHQEDFCQSLTIQSARKYQNEGGPGFTQCFTLLNTMSQPAVDRNALAKIMLFNIFIGNMDAHGKNFSILHKGLSECSLAPFYDLVCTQYYPSLSTKMAMKIGSKYKLEQVHARHWRQLCDVINYSYPALKRLAKKQGEAILTVIAEKNADYVDATQNSYTVNTITAMIEKTITQVLTTFD